MVNTYELQANEALAKLEVLLKNQSMHEYGL
jgi:hypothetical protein